MWSRTGFDALHRSAARRVAHAADRRRAARRLFLESLEGRNLMAFNVLAEYDTGPVAPDIALTPIDPGGQLDLVVLKSADAASVRLGNGAGGFGGPQDSAAGPSPRAVAAGDISGDAIPDLVTANS